LQLALNNNICFIDSGDAMCKSILIAFQLVIVLCFSMSLSAATVVNAKNGCAGVQLAVNQLPASGGEVHLNAGLYLCNKPIVLAKNNISLRGEGGATRLRLADKANAPVIIMGSSENVPSHTTLRVSVSHLVIDGNREQQISECMGGVCSPEFPLRNNGISIRRCEDCKVHGVTVHSVMSGGLVTELGCRRLTISNYNSYDNQFDGLAGYETEYSTFSNIVLYENNAAGISTDIQFNRNQFHNITIYGNKSVGIFMRDSLDNNFTNMHIYNNAQHGIFLAQVDDDPSKAATGNTFSAVVVSASGGMGLQVNDMACVNNILVASQLIDNESGCIGEAGSGLIETAGVICR
jgi:hypothetical protein